MHRDSEIKKVFDLLDVDHSGYLSVDEYPKAVRALGLNPSNSELQEIIKEADKDRDGKLNFQEFLQMYASAKVGHDYDLNGVQNLCDVIGVTANEKISMQELKNVLSGEGEPLTDREIKKILKDFGKNPEIRLQDLIQGLMN